MLLAIWTISFSLLVPPLLGVWGTLGLDHDTFSCTILKKHGRSPKKLFFVVGFFVPCLVIIISYACIYWKVRTSRKNLEAHQAQSSGGVKRKKTGFQKKEDSRVTKLMLIIFCSFLLCYLPLMLANTIDDQMKIPSFHIVASVLAWASAVVNPFIYAGTNKLYREAYKKLLCPRRCAKSGKASGGLINGPRALHSHSSRISSQPT